MNVNQPRPINAPTRPPPGGVRPPAPMNTVPGAIGRPPLMNPQGSYPARPMPPHPSRPPMMGSAPPPPRPQQPIATVPPGPSSPPAVNPVQSDLVSPMQNMHIQPPPVQPVVAGRTKRVYAVNPEVSAASTGQAAPWPHGLPPQQQPQQQMASPAAPPSMVPPPQVAPSTTSASGSAGIGYHNGPYAHSQQNLPPELRPPQQPRPRIDPDQMPAPVQVREQDQTMFEDKFFGTLERDRVPLATTSYIGLDQGNCNPRYMRSTLDKMPFSKDLADSSKLPIGLLIQPLAKLRADEVPIQVVNHGPTSIPGVSLHKEGNGLFAISVPIQTKASAGRFALDPTTDDFTWDRLQFLRGRRADVEQRPELRYGSVEFEVPQDYYSARAPVPLSYVFAIDVSSHSVQSGVLRAACEALKEALYGNNSAEHKIGPGNRIGLITFDRGVHFYNLAPSLTQAQMLVVPDVNDMFLPLQDGFLVDPWESKDIIVELLDNLPNLFEETRKYESVFTSAVRGGLRALDKTGGQLFVFQSCLPTYGPDALTSRDNKTLYNTDKERTLIAVQNESYKELGKECAKNGVCVNTWLLPSQYADAATLGVVSELTGGDLRYFPNFNCRETGKLVYQLQHDLNREAGYDGVLRIRCSDGMQVIDHYGNCHMSTYTDVELAGIDEDKAIAAVLKHDSKLDIDRGVSFQSALLYTTKCGKRRVRVHNLHLNVVNQIAEVFRYGDVDTSVSVMLRKAIFELQHKNRKDIHQRLTEDCVQILSAYRINCAFSTSQGQLILPEAFKLLPVYIHASLRSHPLRGVGVDMNSDVRAAAMKMFNGMSVKELVWTLYPRMFALHDMNDECGMPDKGEINLPPMIRASYERLDQKGAYFIGNRFRHTLKKPDADMDILDTGSDLFLWLGSKVSSEFLEGVFGVPTLDQIDPNMFALPALTSDKSHQVHNIARQLQSERSRYLQLRIVRQEIDPLEFVFSTWMAEDRNAEVQTYVDYMCVLHRKIQEEMKKVSQY
ncbi:COPII coat Sec23p-Sfb3p heterodimer component [Apophysomyces ossiformis]|uniref:COPII coat Sec23p-Sfb3p heterodimer component n=1 Tax=Apophysomyces ossiformis TaxID=679940 RepID=A0A8H7BUL2_9FUNG|nr:COPII coat Sec23p-Sfb3p heterodimer component [Apophysomyces ossiformis]